MSPKNNRLFNIILFLCILMTTGDAFAVSADCKGTSFSPWNDVCWTCIYPIKIATVTIAKDRDNLGGTDTHNSVFCSCTYETVPYYRIGTTFTYWEPLRYIETVKTPYCFPGLGYEMERGSAEELYGGKATKAGASMAAQVFGQAHDWKFNTWSIFGLLLDSTCVSSGGYDFSYMTETDAQWNDGELDTFIDSEKIIFANPASVMACAIDAAAATVTFPLDIMFWCQGAWGTVYPITGNISNAALVVANASLAGRLIFKLTKEFTIWDGAVDLCNYTPTYVWIKSHYKLQPIRPITVKSCFPLGKPGLLWTSGLNPPGGTATRSSDNFVWMVFSKKECCAM